MLARLQSRLARAAHVLVSISSADGGGGSPAVLAVGRSLLPLPPGTRLRNTHPAPSTVLGWLARPPDTQTACA